MHINIPIGPHPRPCPTCGHCPTCGRTTTTPPYAPYAPYQGPKYPWQWQSGSSKGSFPPNGTVS